MVDHKSIKILTDEIETDPGLDFQRYANTVVELIMGSEPKMSIGIYGEWGTGKTTLMKMIEKQLKQIDNGSNVILPVWFNAWRFEREDQFAMIALMKTLAYGMTNHPNFQSISDIILNGLKIIGKDALRSLALQTALTEKGIDEFEKKLTPKMDFINKLDKETIYFDGLTTIESKMDEIIKTNAKSRIIVFIDDLDRCSSQKALEVFESVKVFLDIKGFIYVMGLSHETLARLITQQYRESGIKGEHYIQKIIQIPIRIPPWNKTDIKNIIESQIAKKLERPHSEIIIQHKDLISKVAESNPRGLKRFINNVILANEIFTIEKIEYDQLLVVEALKGRWNSFYLVYSTDAAFRSIISEFKEYSEDLRKTIFRYWDDPKQVTESDMREIMEHIKPDEDVSISHQYLIKNMDDDLWKFLIDTDISRIISKINWEFYRRVASSTEDTPYKKAASKEMKGQYQQMKSEKDEYSDYSESYNNESYKRTRYK